jgi:hypothetical protein
MLHDRIEDIGQAFIASTKDSLGDSATRMRLLEEYKLLDLHAKSIDETADNALHFANDIGFYAPLMAIVSGWPKKAYAFAFNEPNPWPGRYQGVATHVLDAAFLFQNYNEFLDEAQKGSAKVFGEHFVDFVVGAEPYPPYVAGEGGAMIYGPGEKRQRFVKSSKSEDYGRRSTIFKLAESSGLEKLSDAWGVFMRGG